MAPRKSRFINTKLAGVSQANPDGTERQDLIRELVMGEMVLLVRDHGNEHDYYATQVQTRSGQTIGWSPRRKTPEVGSWMDDGQLAIANVTSRGSAPGEELVGVNIDIMLVSEEDRPQVEAKIRRLWRQLISKPREKNPAPQIQVTEREGFPKSMIFLGVVLSLFMACGFAVCGG